MKEAEQLRKAGLRATPTRGRILRALIRAEQPLSAEQLLRHLQTSARKEFDLVTIYRNLAAFTEAGLAGAVDLGTGKTLYEYMGRHRHHHHHVVCRVCETIEHVDVCGIGSQLKKLARMGYTQLSHRLEFFGTCRRCAAG
ncbi:MAG: transcriptional repressor [Bdellovibrionales bacterium]|nr:transcriptional repressor [Bdellovibrionales bacterium]